MKFWIVDQIGGTYVFTRRRDARQFAKAEKAGGAEDLTLRVIDASDSDVLQAVAEVATRKGGKVVKRFTETPKEFL